ncbi:cyclase family protein [Anaeromyxobacter terrae]|uniref:cyclase family protein n=1 Tax=Anaeromyxobacter terrae TaxID=2925406 RepID=UPI001F589AF7|nr:cyclase family protein [Anaeromyxobacter sp. SG22]
MAQGGWIDVTVPIRDGMMHWPGDPAVHVERVRALAADGANVSSLRLGAHTGTHVDAPLHYVEGGAAVDAMPLALASGPARVVAVDDPVAIRPEHLETLELRRGERVLFRTRNSPRAWRSDRFVEDAVHLTPEAAALLVARGIAPVGIDYLSVGPYRGEDGATVHRTLLEGGVWILEGLDLTDAPEGAYELLCLPLRLAGGDGAPARALLRPGGAEGEKRDGVRIG